jgi:hypothetical protein
VSGWLDHRQKRTGWLLVAISGAYLIWFIKTRLFTAGVPIDKKEWLYFGAMLVCLMLGTANLRLAAMRDEKKKSEQIQRMSTISSVDVREAVADVLEQILGRDRSSFGFDDRLVRDLCISSDDLSFMFVPELERRLGVKVNVSDWRNVHTGRDACELLGRYVEEAKAK